MKPCMDHIPAFIFLCSNLPKPLHRPPVFEERLECTHFTRSVTRLHVQLSPRKYCQQPQQEQEIPRACKSKQQQWQQALLRSQIIATTGTVSGSYAACIRSPDKEEGIQQKKRQRNCFSSWSTRLSTTTTIYHSCTVFLCFCYLLLELLALLPGELQRPQRHHDPWEPSEPPTASLELLFEKPVRFQLCLKDRKTTWMWTIAMRQTLKRMYFLFPISWSKRNIHSCRILQAFWPF